MTLAYAPSGPTSVDAAADPFTQIHQAIWQALTNDDDWRAVASKSGAWINTLPEKGNLIGKPLGAATGDTPELRLLQSAFSEDSQNTNSVAYAGIQSFRLSYSTSNRGVQAALNPLKWATICALKRAGDDLRLPHLIRDTMPDVGSESYTSTAIEQTNVEHWVAVHTFKVWFFVPWAIVLGK